LGWNPSSPSKKIAQVSVQDSSGVTQLEDGPAAGVAIATAAVERAIKIAGGVKDQATCGK